MGIINEHWKDFLTLFGGKAVPAENDFRLKGAFVLGHSYLMCEIERRGILQHDDVLQLSKDLAGELEGEIKSWQQAEATPKPVKSMNLIGANWEGYRTASNLVAQLSRGQSLKPEDENRMMNAFYCGSIVLITKLQEMGYMKEGLLGEIAAALHVEAKEKIASVIDQAALKGSRN